MSTGAHYEPKTPALPVPLVKIRRWPTSGNNGFGGDVDADGNNIVWLNTICVTANVDPALLDKRFQLEAQLWRWKPRGSVKPKGWRGWNGWTCPADWDPYAGVYRVGADYGCGKAADINCARRTRLPVKYRNEILAFNLGGFFRETKYQFIDWKTSGPGAPSMQTISARAALPFDRAWNVHQSYRSAWTRRRLVNKFAVSWSIVDSDGRGRIFGPLSPVVVAGTSRHPCVEHTESLITNGFKSAAANPLYDSTEMQCWWDQRQSR